MSQEEQKKLKLNYAKTFLIGFGFCASSIAWIIYNARVPLILKENPTISGFAASGTLIGFIMVIDNIFGVVFQPLFGKISDRTHTRFGKRTPFLIVGIPICAILFTIIPWLQTRIILLIPCIILFNFIMSTWRSPVVALMPDLTPSELRSEGNAVINIMGGVGTVLGTVAGSIFGLFTDFANDSEERKAVFAFGSVIMVICLLVVVFAVREPDNRITKEESLRLKAEYKKGTRTDAQHHIVGKLSKEEKKSLIFMLIALFFNSNATDSIQTYFTTFATSELKFSESNASLIITLFAAATVIGAIPAGKLGRKFGRKKTIMTGWAVILAMFLAYGVSRWYPLLYVAIVVGGAFISLVTINTLPLVLEIGGEDKVGTFTGYYYTATFSASIVGPVLCGAIFDITHTYWSLFIYCPICFALALLCMSQVKHGEANYISDEIIEQATKDD